MENGAIMVQWDGIKAVGWILTIETHNMYNIVQYWFEFSRIKMKHLDRENMAHVSCMLVR